MKAKRYDEQYKRSAVELVLFSGKQHTQASESHNSRGRHYLARFHRRTKCYSKSAAMGVVSLTLFFYLFDARILRSLLRR